MNIGKKYISVLALVVTILATTFQSVKAQASCSTSGECEFGCDPEGTCTDGYYGDYCITSEHCEYACDSINKQCTGGYYPDYCTNSDHCQEYSCDSIKNECTNGYPGDYCTDSDHCSEYICDSKIERCADGYPGAYCITSDHCSEEYSICDLNINPDYNECTGGYWGDYCTTSDHCEDEYSTCDSIKNECTYGYAGDYCENDNECRSNACFIQDKVCQGNVGEECDSNDHCLSSNCSSENFTCEDAIATSGGDPHFMGFNGQLFSYHGECDLMLMQSRKHGVTVHIRTTRIDHPLISYSFISNAAIKVADNILEVSDDGSLFVNGNDASESDMMFLPSAFDGFKLIRTTKGTKSNILAYMLDLGQDRFVEIRCNKKTGMLFIDVGGTFSDSEGLLGNSGTEELYSRDGSFDLTGQWNSLAEEWQVRSDEPMLFHEVRYPQFPAGCSYESSTSTSSNLRRRLLGGTMGVSKDVAKKACANAASSTMMEYCITDVMVTGEVDIADDEFYQQQHAKK